MMRILNKLLALLMGIFVIYYSIIDNNFLHLFFLIALIIPFIIKLPPLLTFSYLIMIFMGIFLGFQVHLYKKTDYFDSLVHLISGMILAIPALWILIKYQIIDKKFTFNVVFILCFSMAIALSWEIVEYIIDNLVGSDMQRIGTGVNDTMMDVILGTSGTLLFVIFYTIETKLKKKLFINKIIEEMK